MLLLQMLTEHKIVSVVHSAGINQTLIEMSQEYTNWKKYTTHHINLTPKSRSWIKGGVLHFPIPLGN
jgi:hypothetical protein